MIQTVRNWPVSLKEFQAAFDRNVESFNNLQKEKFGALEIKQNELIAGYGKKAGADAGNGG